MDDRQEPTDTRPTGPVPTHCTWKGHQANPPEARYVVQGPADSIGGHDFCSLFVCDSCLERLQEGEYGMDVRDIEEFRAQVRRRRRAPDSGLKPLGDDVAEIMRRAVEKAGPGAPRERVEDEFLRLVAEAVGEPPGIRRRATVLDEIDQTYKKLADAVLGAMMWPEPDEEREKARRALAAARDKLAGALADPPDPADAAAWPGFARRAWNDFTELIGWALPRAVLGDDARREEDRPPEAARDPDTGEMRTVVDPLADLASLEVAARQAERAAEWIDALRSVATKREIVYLDEADRLVEEGEPVEEAMIKAGKPLGLDANGARQLRKRLRDRYQAEKGLLTPTPP